MNKKTRVKIMVNKKSDKYKNKKKARVKYCTKHRVKITSTLSIVSITEAFSSNIFKIITDRDYINRSSNRMDVMMVFLQK